MGATRPEDSGYYFWWGDTVGCKRVGDHWVAVDGTRNGFSFNSENCPTSNKDNSQLLAAGYIDSTGKIVPKYDAATAHLGAPWRMPTEAEITALVANCDTAWTVRNGVAGRLVKGRGVYSSRSIFLPAAGYGNNASLLFHGSCGYCWSSTSGYYDIAPRLYINSSHFRRSSYYRYCGQSVRAVRGFAK